MNKPAKTIYPINELLKNRWSPRAFSNKEIAEDQMLQIIEAAGWSFSCANEQPWCFIYGHRGTETFEKILMCLDDANKVWAKDAAVLFVSIAKTTFAKTGKENLYAYHDVGAANMSIALEGMSNGIYTHFMAGFDQSKVIEIFSLNSQEKPVTISALGYFGDVSSLPDYQQQRETAERRRKPLTEIIYKR